MFKTKAGLYALLAAFIVVIFISSGSAWGQCYGALSLSPDFFGYDYLVRLCVHFGDPSSIPDQVQCCRTMNPDEEYIDFPIYLYNAHEGVRFIEFGVTANDTIVSFVPENGFMIYSAYNYKEDGVYKLDLAVKSFSPVCAPVLVGYAKVERAHGVDPIWLDLRQNKQTGRMMAQDVHWYTHYLVSPHHGGYVGSSYLYACQPPVCPEPNDAVEDFNAEMAHGCAVQLTWRAGGGNTTIICYRTDRFPTGYDDGELAVEMPSMPGEELYYFQTNMPLHTILYYKAFSVTKDSSGNILTNSFVECSSVDTVMTSCEIAVDNASWGEIKSMYK